jgi:hypothetical protein
VGLLFGAFEKSVSEVLLLDARRPRSFDVLLAAATEVAPWLPAKVTYLTADVTRLPGGGAHARTATARALRRGQPSGNSSGGGGHSESMMDSESMMAELGDSDESTNEDAFSAQRDETDAACARLRSLPPGRAGFLALHACGALTDACIGVAIAAAGPLAALPCCYTGAAAGAPRGAQRVLGGALAADVARMYRLEREGFTCDFAALPRAVTPMNRALVAVPRRAAAAAADVAADVASETTREG